MKPVGVCIGLLLSQIAHGAVGAGPATQPRTGLETVERAVIGQLDEIDTARSQMSIRVTAGVDQVFVFDRRTEVRGIPKIGRVPELAAEQGANVLVHYSMLGSRKFARSIEHLGIKPVKSATGLLLRIERAGGPIILRTSAGDELFFMAERMTIECCDGVVSLAAFDADLGSVLTVYYTESRDAKRIHLLRYDMAAKT